MSYLKNKNNKVVVDAILTKYGEAKLASQGNLDIVKWAVADDEIDYGLYNNTHPDGSDFYGSALTNLPILEALPEEYMSMQYPLFSIVEGGVDAISELQLNISAVTTGSGIENYTVYPITPSFNPTPGDVTRIYHVAKITIPEPVVNPPVILPPIIVPPVVPPAVSRPAGSPSSAPIEAPVLPGGGGGGTVGEGQTSNGMRFKLNATINDDIGITNEIIAARGYYIDTGKYKYAVGHGFTFNVTRFGRAIVYLPMTVTPFGINARPVTITLRINGRAIAQPKPPIAVQ
jgi:hypothetical protein